MWQKCDNQLMIQAIRLRNVGVSFIGQISSAPKIFLLRKPQVVITTDVQQHGNWKNEILSAVFELYRSGNGVFCETVGCGAQVRLSALHLLTIFCRSLKFEKLGHKKFILRCEKMW